MPFFLIAVFGANLMLVGRSAFYKITFMGELAVLAIGVGGILGLKMGRVGNILKFLFVTLLAHWVAWFRTFAGISDTTWTPQR